MVHNAALFLARLLLGYLFVRMGLATLGDLAGSASYFASLGFPAPGFVASATGLFELVAGVLVVAGFKTRIAALSLALFSLLAGLIGHLGQGDDPALAFLHWQALMKDLAIAGGFLALLVAGPGGWSLDAKLQQAAGG